MTLQENNEQLQKQIESLEIQLEQLQNKLPENEKAEIESKFKGSNIAGRPDAISELHKTTKVKLLQSDHVAPGVILYTAGPSETLSS